MRLRTNVRFLSIGRGALTLVLQTLPKLPTRQVVFPLPNPEPPRAVETTQQPAQRKRRALDVVPLLSSPPMRKSSSIALAKLRETAERDRGVTRNTPSRSVSMSNYAPPSGNETSKPALAGSIDKLPVGIASPLSEEEQQRSSVPIAMGASDVVKMRNRPEEKKGTGAAMHWTLAEQRRLEQLLVEYPDEPVSSHRWEKIARALGRHTIRNQLRLQYSSGHRTPKQVANRVQQFFVRLSLQNKPLPGGGKPPNLELVRNFNLIDPATSGAIMRPNLASSNFSLQYLNKRRKELDQKNRRRRLQAAGAGVSAGVQAPTVYMSDDDSVGDEPELADLDDEFKNTEEYKELVRLRRIQAERKREANVKVVHFDFRVRCWLVSRFINDLTRLYSVTAVVWTLSRGRASAAPTAPQTMNLICARRASLWILRAAPTSSRTASSASAMRATPMYCSKMMTTAGAYSLTFDVTCHLY